MIINGHEIDISDREKVLFPEGGFTKGDVIDYYKEYGSLILSYLMDRPISMECAPSGVAENVFYQKKVPSHFPHWITQHDVPLKSSGSNRQVIVDAPETLVYLADQACFAVHPWLSRIDTIENPDRVVFDLDVEEGDDFPAVLNIARILYEHLPISYVMLTGGVGVHVVVPIEPTHDFDDVREIVKDFCNRLASSYPDEVTTEMKKEDRGERVFLDYLRNAYGQTTIAPYTVRAKSNGSIAVPVDWDELSKIDSADIYTLKNIRRRLAQKEDPWRDMQDNAVPVETLKTVEV